MKKIKVFFKETHAQDARLFHEYSQNSWSSNDFKIEASTVFDKKQRIYKFNL